MQNPFRATKCRSSSKDGLPSEDRTYSCSSCRLERAVLILADSVEQEAQRSKKEKRREKKDKKARAAWVSFQAASERQPRCLL